MRNWEINVADDSQMVLYRNLEDAILIYCRFKSHNAGSKF